ncbi:hypothetical protein [Phenylobacterium sp.]|uniref:hypothetical protein n=1 Tax=Phenylobacterium sp. TaxID=1871053 RepID=UPI0025FFDCD5|nr:hypothetical protein [Phenylobacterium sp.]
MRRSHVEVRTYVEALADRLERALPDRVTVERKREGLFSKETHVASLTFRGDKAIYALTIGKGQVTATRGKVVRGVSISSTQMQPPEWLAELGDELRIVAQQTGEASEALLGFL